jgi:hypothetical protein
MGRSSLRGPADPFEIIAAWCAPRRLCGVRHDRTMPGKDALSAAIEDLYSHDPESFVDRRGALANRARQDGDTKAAHAITGLRRPTKAAWIINRLVRAEPEIAAGLAELGAQLRKAQRAFDGARLRQLTHLRRQMIDSAIRHAFAGQAAPSASLRHEVASTLEAGLADPDVAEQLRSGTLVRSAEWSGFGEAAHPLSAVLTQRPGSGSRPTSAQQNRAASTQRPGRASLTSTRATQTVARAEQRQQQAPQFAAAAAAAADALAAADTELDSAAAAEQEQDEKVGVLTAQLADARLRLNEARLRVRAARSRQRQAQRRLERARHRST